MAEAPVSVDQLYLNAESLAQDFSLFPRKETASVLHGVLTEQQIEIQVDTLRHMDVDAYIAATIAPCEEATRPGAKDIIQALGVTILEQKSDGPIYTAECEFDFQGAPRRIGFIAQDRAYASGVWGPEHHDAASRVASDFAIRSLPIVTMKYSSLSAHPIP